MSRSDGETLQHHQSAASEVARGIDDRRVAASGTSSALERTVLLRIAEGLGNPRVRLALWDGFEVAPRGVELSGRLWFRDRGALFRIAADPDMQFGEMYSAGRVEVEGSLVSFITAVYRSAARRTADHPWRRLANAVNGLRRNTPNRARDNIYHHYDIGNDFYRLWLDSGMVYTCAYFPDPELGLEEAQVAKMDHIARKLWLRPGERVVEAGCGWGSLALHLAARYGVSVDAYNISREQLAYARERAAEKGLGDRVRFVEADYREIRGEYDAFVSVGMLEHVGPYHYPELARTITRVLRPDGRGLIHSIGRDAPGAMNSWIERRVFPGARPPSLSEMSEIFEPAGLSVLDIENLRLHYARTLEHWSERFESASDEVREMFDESFVRAWRLYLAGSTAAFLAGTLQLFQVVFARAGSNAIPWTREQVYRHGD
jgi:cyclopropane-fatty-acyl-phospholipid synthase